MVDVQSIATDEKTGIHEVQFPNGLKLLLLERHHLPIVSVMISYRVGGAHCGPGNTGIAHFLEHLLFKGTKKFPKGEIDSLTQKLGGANNAYTCADYTSYFFDFLKENWEIALEIEADRMVNCVWDEQEFEAEKSVILEEIATSEDSPAESLLQEAHHSFYKFHPYRYPILGWKEDLQKLSRDEVTHFYQTHYVPNNAVLILVGDIQKEEAISKVEKYFSEIPSKKVPTFPWPKENLSLYPRQLTLKPSVDTHRFVWMFPTCQAGTEDELVLDLLDIILSSGKASRLYRRFVSDEHLLQSFGSINTIYKEEGIFYFLGELIPGVAPSYVASKIQEEIEKLKKEKIESFELQKAKNIFLAGFLFSQETNHDIADKINQSEMQEGYKALSGVVSEVQAITEEQIQEVCQKYFALAPSLLAWSHPEEFSVPSRRRKIKKEIPEKEQSHTLPLLDKDRKIAFHYGSGVKRTKDALEIESFILPNGLTLLVLENHTIPGVSVKLQAQDATGFSPPGKEGLSTLFGPLLTEGTQKHTREEIAHTLEFVGASLVGKPNGVTAKLLSQDLPMTLGWMAEIVQYPLFESSALDREKKKLKARRISLRNDPQANAGKAFRKKIYGKHPYAQTLLGTPGSLANIQPKDLFDYQKQYFVPNRSVLAIAGDVEPKKVYDLVEKAFGSWERGKSTPIQFPEIEVQRQPYTKWIALDKKQQLWVYFGHLSIRRMNPDYYKVLLLEQILGQGEGFTDRLSKKIRDQYGLCYHVDCSLTALCDKEYGMCVATLATTPEKYPLAMQTLQEEFALLQKEGVTAEELASTKAYMKSKFIFGLEDNESLCSYLLTCAYYDLGFDYISRLPKIIDSITREDLQEVAQRYLHPYAATTVVAGPVDKIKK